jgi:hypothetical protein
MSTLAFFFISMAIMCFIYLICSIRTNMVFFMIFLTLVLAFACLAGSFFEANNGHAVLAARLQVAGGAFAFCTTLFGWWIFIAIMLASLDFPFSVPGKCSLKILYGSLLTVDQLAIYPASSKARAKETRTSRYTCFMRSVQILYAV